MNTEIPRRTLPPPPILFQGSGSVCSILTWSVFNKLRPHPMILMHMVADPLFEKDFSKTVTLSPSCTLDSEALLIKRHSYPSMWNLKKTNEQTKRNRFINTENKEVVARGVGGCVK